MLFPSILTNKVKIIIADDQTIVRQSISVALATQSDFDVIGQAENGKVLIELVSQNEPDVIILDLQMPVMDGWQAMDYLKVHHPLCKTVVLSMHLDIIVIKDLVSRGARGFLPKSSDFETLISAIYEVNEIGYYFSDKVSSSLVDELLSAHSIEPPSKELNLTAREVEVLMLICEDKNGKEIAEALYLSDEEIDRYKITLMMKTNSKTAAGLVLFALKNNLISIKNKSV